MLLLEYMKSLTKDQLENFAERCETSVGQLRHVAHGTRRCGESLAINIDRESHGTVRCEVLRPDVDWAHLRESSPSHSEKRKAGVKAPAKSQTPGEAA